ncbi:MAG: potassium channel protein [Pseudomonadota bacterium]
MSLRTLLIGLALVLITGTVGFHFLEHQTYLDAFYMTAVTVTTVGFTNATELTPYGKIFQVLILFAGFGVAFAALSQLAASLFRGELQQVLGRRRMEQEIRNMKDHYILCGLGRVGHVIAEEFFNREIPFVIVDKDPETVRGMTKLGQFAYVKGNAEEEEVLKSAGIANARGIVAAVGSDADNAFICMTARSLNPKLRVVTRATDPKNITKLKYAGADKVVSPYSIAGTRMAQTILNPSLVDFMEIAADQSRSDVDMADVEIPRDSAYDGIRLDHAEMKDLDVIIIGIHRGDQAMDFHPAASSVLHSGDRLVAVGRPDHIQRMIQRASQRR